MIFFLCSGYEYYTQIDSANIVKSILFICRGEVFSLWLVLLMFCTWCSSIYLYTHPVSWVFYFCPRDEFHRIHLQSSIFSTLVLFMFGTWCSSIYLYNHPICCFFGYSDEFHFINLQSSVCSSFRFMDILYFILFH